MEGNDLRILIVYYSLEGNVKLIAESIAEEIHSDTLKLEVEKPIPIDNKKYFVGGKQAMFKEKPKLIPYEFNAENYDVLFIGTPVWAWTYAPAIRTFFEENSVKNKKIALFSCNEGGNGKTFEKMKKALEGNEFLGEIEFFAPLKGKREESVELAKSWAREMIISH
ncbi:flavodoxin [Clostridium sp.]|uniref:flavodoxin family protein n=1 Tax=Clostridium sp. TaxID=1506 RepID=UPI0028450104|nr:flavodoxin [Clostridium sp.]MDR3595626.1 flavodoxin [Clostridium sp.]